MGSTFSGLNTALTSLYAQRRGLDVTGQNIANANTEGYTRQRVVMHAQNANLVPGVYATTDAIGGGVTVSSVERLRNTALDQRSYTEHANSAFHNERAGVYNLVEDVFGEPSDTALQARLQDMWDGWNDVGANPTMKAPKSALLEQATTVAASLNDAAAALNSQYTSTRGGLDTYVGDVNAAARSIAKLNQEIVVAHEAGLQANELMDQRGRQILKLSEMVGATATDLPNGAISVYIGSAQLVSEYNVREIEIKQPAATRLEDLPLLDVTLQWSDNDGVVHAGGTMGAQLETLGKNGILKTISNRLDTIATYLARDVNSLHESAYGLDGSSGLQFFVDGSAVPQTDSTINASNIAVNKDLLDDVDKVAVSSGNPTAPQSSGARILDGDLAFALSELDDAQDGADAEYRALIGELGVSAQSAIRRRDIQNAVTDQVDASRDAESGVNLDEEMTNLLTYQRGYEAASRVLTTIDSMLDQLINRTGLVGR
ncbi:flagellar hook-associated protein FlgK [Actinoplanes sp. NPDC049802]|uniref:flagellar hook-associated protein FlgK n=1 Tax=Actinoplanes sp. NPDC049802 TaxID=3154742 RepID=UPI0033CC7CAF